MTATGWLLRNIPCRIVPYKTTLRYYNNICKCFYASSFIRTGFFLVTILHGFYWVTFTEGIDHLRVFARGIVL